MELDEQLGLQDSAFHSRDARRLKQEGLDYVCFVDIWRGELRLCVEFSGRGKSIVVK